MRSNSLSNGNFNEKGNNIGRKNQSIDKKNYKYQNQISSG